MTFKSNTTPFATSDGIPYIWNSGDVTTAPTVFNWANYPSGSYTSPGSGASNNQIVNPVANATAYDQFGFSVAIDNGYIAIGVPGDDTTGSEIGGVYVYDVHGKGGKLVYPYTATNAQQNFGYSVALGCGYLVVGTPYDDDNGSQSGAAYLYKIGTISANGQCNTQVVTNVAKIKASDGSSSDYYGWSVAISAGKIIIGTGNKEYTYVYDLAGTEKFKIRSTDYGAAYFQGKYVAAKNNRIVLGAPGSIIYKGYAFVHDLNGNRIAVLQPSDIVAGDYFGEKVAVGSGRIVVGARGKQGSMGEAQGAAYIYDLDGNFIKKITTPDHILNDNDNFGYAVDVGCGRILIGAYGVNVGINSNGGAVYVYDLDGNYISKIVPANQNSSDAFGSSVAIDNGRIVVGSLTSRAGSEDGSVYLYSTPFVFNLYDIIEKQSFGF